MRILLPALLTAILLAPPHALAEEREYIYGAELMTSKERDNYRSGMQDLPRDETRDAYRQRHRERLNKRAQRRGVQLDEQGIIRRDGDNK